MSSDNVDLEKRLKSLLAQLQTEYGILDRIVYKGKNQHRRCQYFQYILKVRRDLRLVQSAGLEEIFRFLFQVINEKKPAQKVYLLDRLKKATHHNGKHNFQERLLGVARLLSQMVDPILKAAMEISSLLARSFFMGFSLTILSLLARIRVLVQQMLLDVVSVYNMVTSLSQKEHSVKITQKGIEVFREYYPPSGKLLTLECMWEVDKFVLLEQANKSKINNQDEDLGDGSAIPLGTSTIQYQSIEVLNGDEFDSEKIHMDTSVEGLTSPIDINRPTTNSSSYHYAEINDGAKIENCAVGDPAERERSPNEDTVAEGDVIARTSPSMSPKSLKPETGLGNKVAFVSIRKHAIPGLDDSGPGKKFKGDSLSGRADETEDPFFSLLMGGNMKDSLF